MEKKGKILLVVTIVLAVIIVVGGGYLVYAKVLKKSDDKPVVENTNTNTNTNTNENDTQVIALDTNGDLVQDLYMGLRIFPCLDNYFYTHSNVISENMEIERKFKYAIQRLDAKDIKMVADPEYASTEDGASYVMFEISEDLMEKALKNALGENAVLEKKDVISDTNPIFSFVYKENGEKYYGNVGVLYNSTKKTFTIKMNDIGGFGCSGQVTKIESAVKEGKIITITEKAIFVDDSTEVNGEYIVYSDINYTKKIGKVSAQDYENYLIENQTQTILNQYISSAMTIIYTFEENEDGSYHFVSSKMTN